MAALDRPPRKVAGSASRRPPHHWLALCLPALSACAFWDLTSTWSDGHPQDVADATPRLDGGSSIDGGGESGSGSEAGLDGGSAYAEAVLADHPLGYWTLDEISGTVAHDSSGNGHDGQLEGAVTWGADGAIASGTGATLDGGDIRIGGDSVLFGFTNKHPFSIEAWARATKLDDLYRRIVSKERPASPRDGYTVWIQQRAPQPVVGLELLVADVGAADVAPFRGAVYVHVVAVHDGGTSSVYVDGALAASGPMDVALVEQPGPLTWGGTPFSTAGAFAGALDELAIYDHALSSQAVAAHYAARGR